jgi:hypothetical protein
MQTGSFFPEKVSTEGTSKVLIPGERRFFKAKRGKRI